MRPAQLTSGPKTTRSSLFRRKSDSLVHLLGFAQLWPMYPSKTSLRRGSMRVWKAWESVLRTKVLLEEDPAGDNPNFSVYWKEKLYHVFNCSEIHLLTLEPVIQATDLWWNHKIVAIHTNPLVEKLFEAWTVYTQISRPFCKAKPFVQYFETMVAFPAAEVYNTGS